MVRNQDQLCLIEMSRSSGLNPQADASPYFVATVLARRLDLKPKGQSENDRFYWLTSRFIATMPGSQKSAAPAPMLPKSGKLDDFYKTWEWRRLRMQAIKRYGPRCMCCGATPSDVDGQGKPVKIVVDHIKPGTQLENIDDMVRKGRARNTFSMR